MAVNKVSNDYARAIDPKLYAAIPKAVFAAIALSPHFNGEGNQTPEAFLRAEWAALHANGIVPQRPV